MQDQTTTARPYPGCGCPEYGPSLRERAAAWVTRAARWVGRKLAALWRMLPGPWWVKVALLVLCLAIPGPGDEIALLAVTGFLAARKARRMRQARAQVAR